MTFPKQVPGLRFQSFEGNWNVVSLGTLIEFKNGKPLEPQISNTGKVCLITLDSIDIHGVLKKRHKMIVEPNGSLQPGDLVCVLSTVAADLRKSNLLGMSDFIPSDEHEYALNQRMGRIRSASEAVHLGFIRLILNNSRTYFGRCGQGTSQKHIYQRDFDSLVFSIPSVREQKKITGFLTAVDEKIDKLKRKKELLEEYKKGMMQKLFSQEIRFKDEDGNNFPDWEFWRLGALTTKTGKRNKAGRNLPIYSINNKVGFNPQADEFEGLDSVERGYDTTAYKVISRNTFAYNPARVNVGSLGYSGDLHDVIISSLYVCFQTHDLIDDQFLWQYFRGSEFRKEVVRKSEGGVRLYLFYENFSGIPLMLPSLMEQQKIADVLNKSDDLIASLNSQIDRAVQFKRGLLQKMFV